MKLVARTRPMYADDIFDSDLKQNIYAFDSTTIDLCLVLFPWADFRETKAAIKLHTLLDMRGSIPVFIGITDGKTTDNKILDELVLEPGAFYAIDRGYLDLKRLCRIQDKKAFFVIRSKSNLKLTRIKSLPVEKDSDVCSDKIVRFKHAKSFGDFPHYLRRVRIFDKEQSRFLVFLTNNFDLPAKTIALIYKHRWAIETFFKWIKQNLRVKHFFGNSRNAVETQIWIAVCFYLLLAILKKSLDLPYSITEIHQILSVHVFSQEPIHQIFVKIKSQEPITSDDNQLLLNLL
jgi:IS4 transposase